MRWLTRCAFTLSTALACGPTWAGATLAPQAIRAQQLVDRLVSQNPDLLVVAMHVTPPGEKDNVIVASNIGRIGKRADAEDRAVLESGTTHAKIGRNGDRFEVEMALRDAAGRQVGALVIVMPYRQGEDRQPLQRRAERLRDALASEIPDVRTILQSVTR